MKKDETIYGPGLDDYGRDEYMKNILNPKKEEMEQRYFVSVHYLGSILPKNEIWYVYPPLKTDKERTILWFTPIDENLMTKEIS